MSDREQAKRHWLMDGVRRHQAVIERMISMLDTNHLIGDTKAFAFITRCDDGVTVGAYNLHPVQVRMLLADVVLGMSESEVIYDNSPGQTATKQASAFLDALVMAETIQNAVEDGQME